MPGTGAGSAQDTSQIPGIPTWKPLGIWEGDNRALEVERQDTPDAYRVLTMCQKPF